MPSAGFLTYWYLQLPSLLLAALIYLVLGRLILALFLRADNPVMRVVAAVTVPAVAPVGAITPRIVPPSAVLVFAIAWLAALRMVVLWVAMAKGLRL